MNSRLTYSAVSNLMSPEEAKREYDYTVRAMPRGEGFSALHVTRETWNGHAWILDERFDKENR